MNGILSSAMLCLFAGKVLIKNAGKLEQLTFVTSIFPDKKISKV
jgi:hypothetical protein